MVMSETDSAAERNALSLPVVVGMRIFRLFSSVGLALVVLAFLLLITWIGTEEQPVKGLLVVQEEYFKSWWLWHTFRFPFLGAVTLLLPGVMLLLTVFSINLTCGGLIMLRKSWRTVGVMIAHFSILFLLAGGLLQHRFAKDGYMQLYEGESSDEFVSHHDWVIRIHEVKDGKADFEAEALVVPPTVLKDLETGTRRVGLPGLPFDLRLYHHAVNAAVMPAAFRRPGELPVVDEVFLRELPRETKNELNVAALYVDVIDERGEVAQRGILWGKENQPFTVRMGEKAWLLKMDRERWKIPFAIQLNKFTHEFHPNTGTPRVFKSDVTKIQNGESERMVIEMNKPLQDQGYILFQSGWGPQENGMPVPGAPYSVFAVWRNPTSKILLIPVEHWPLVTLVCAAVGIAIHLILKLVRHLAPAPPAATAMPTKT